MLLQFCFVFLLAPWDDVLFDTYSLSLRKSLLICLNDGILVYHLFFFRSFYVLHNCSLLFHISLFKAFQRSLHLPRALLLSFPSCEGSLVPQRFRPFGCPFLWGRDCKGSNLFSSDQIRRKKSPVTETDSSSFALFATVLHHAWQNPYFRVATAKVITYFLLTKSFGKILFFLRRFFPLYPYNKQIFIRSDHSKDPCGTSCSENPYRIPRLGIKKRSATTLRLYRLLNRAALA